MILRVLAALLILVGALGASAPDAAGQDQRELPADLAAMPILPQQLDEPGFQLKRGGYLTIEDARYLIDQRHDIAPDAVGDALEAGSWRQGYTQTLVLLEDRTYRTSTPLAAIETTILAFQDDEGAELVSALLAGAPPGDSESRDPAVDGASTWRMVTSQDDRLVTVARSGRLVFEIASADATGTSGEPGHAAVVQATLDRAETTLEEEMYGLSQRIVSLEDSQLIPMAIDAESPLAHSFYRLIDDTIVPVAGELPEPTREELPIGVEEIVVSRQTAELASQSWLTAGVVVLDFSGAASAEAFAIDGVARDPLDIFAVDEQRNEAMSQTDTVRIESISGETRIGGRYSGYRVSVWDESVVAQLTVRVAGSNRLDQRGVEQWAQAQRGCLTGDPCEPVPLTGLLATPDPATSVTGAFADGLYQSPVAAWSVEFDPDTWSAEESLAEGGYDYLYLRSEQMDATFETIVDQRGDPEQCVLNELSRLREVEDGAYITIGSDDSDEAPGGLEPGHGWVVYTVEPLEESRADEEYTLRIDCYTVLEGSTSLVVQTRAPRDAWPDVADLGEELRSQIDIDGLPVMESGSPHLVREGLVSSLDSITGKARGHKTGPYGRGLSPAWIPSLAGREGRHKTGPYEEELVASR